MIIYHQGYSFDNLSFGGNQLGSLLLHEVSVVKTLPNVAAVVFCGKAFSDHLETFLLLRSRDMHISHGSQAPLCRLWSLACFQERRGRRQREYVECVAASL